MKISVAKTLVSLSMLGILTCTAQPGQAEDYFTKGCEYYKAGHYDYAKKCFEYSAKKRPNHWPSHYQLGNAYRKLGHRMKARAAYDACIHKLPDHKTAKLCQEAIHSIDLETAKIDIAKLKAKEAAKAGLDKPAKVEPTKDPKDIELETKRDEFNKKIAPLVRKKAQILQEGRAQANRIRAEARARVNSMKRNSNQYVRNSRTGERYLGIPTVVTRPILEDADRRARWAMDQAEVRARGIKIPKNPYEKK